MRMVTAKRVADSCNTQWYHGTGNWQIMLLVTDTLNIGKILMVHKIYCLFFNFTIAIQLAWLLYVSHHYFSPESLPEKIALHIYVI